MKWLLYIVGVLFILVGIVWFLQGLNILTSGFMAGHIQYAVLGLGGIILGILLIVLGNRRQGGRPTASR